MTRDEADYNLKNCGYKFKQVSFREEKNAEICFDLSLIVPVYNAEKYLKQCVDSLLNQKTTYNYEIIIINDGSTDGSLKILQKIQHHNNVKIIVQENQGIGAARNCGISLARGKYIGFIDNDDFVAEDYVQTLLYNAEKEDADIVKVSYLEFDSQTNKKLKNFYSETKSNIIEGYIGERLFNFDGFIWGGIYKKNIFDKVRFPVSYWYEDMIVSFLIYRQSNKFVYLANDLYFKRKHQNNAANVIWNSHNVKCLDQFYLLKECIRINDEMNLPHDETFAKLVYRECGFLLGIRTIGLNKKLKRSVFVLASELCKEKQLKDFDVFSKALNNKDYRLWEIATMMRRFDL